MFVTPVLCRRVLLISPLSKLLVRGRAAQCNARCLSSSKIVDVRPRVSSSRAAAAASAAAGLSAVCVAGLVLSYSVVSASCHHEEDSATSGWDDDWDHMACVSDERKKLRAKAKEDGKMPSPLPCRYLVLIRHGQYRYINNDKFPGVSEAVRRAHDDANYLTELGHEQATLTGKRLAELAAKGEFKWDAVYHSDQKRATETAQRIMAELILDQPDLEQHYFIDQMLREGAPAMPVPTHPTYKPSERTISEEGSRIEAAFRKFVHRPLLEQDADTHELLVCHGNVIRYFVCRALQLPSEAWLRLNVSNCGITCICINSNGGVSVDHVGDTGHLPAEKITFA